MDWIQPLELETWLISVFSGDGIIFTFISLLVITAMAGYFRLNGAGLFIMVGIFALMFMGFVPTSIVTIIAIIGGLAIGYLVAQMTSK